MRGFDGNRRYLVNFVSSFLAIFVVEILTKVFVSVKSTLRGASEGPWKLKFCLVDNKKILKPRLAHLKNITFLRWANLGFKIFLSSTTRNLSSHSMYEAPDSVILYETDEKFPILNPLVEDKN